METAKELRAKVHAKAAVNGGISFKDLREAFEDACERLEQQQEIIRDLLPYAKEIQAVEKILMRTSTLGAPEKTKKVETTIAQAEEITKGETGE